MAADALAWREIAESQRGIIADLAETFEGVDDMANLDAADFKDNAGKLWRLIVTARAALAAYDKAVGK